MQRQSLTCPQISQCHSKHEDQRVPQRLSLRLLKAIMTTEAVESSREEWPSDDYSALAKSQKSASQSPEHVSYQWLEEPCQVDLVFQ